MIKIRLELRKFYNTQTMVQTSNKTRIICSGNNLINLSKCEAYCGLWISIYTNNKLEYNWQFSQYTKYDTSSATNSKRKD